MKKLLIGLIPFLSISLVKADIFSDIGQVGRDIASTGRQAVSGAVSEVKEHVIQPVETTVVQPAISAGKEAITFAQQECDTIYNDAMNQFNKALKNWNNAIQLRQQAVRAKDSRLVSQANDILLESVQALTNVASKISVFIVSQGFLICSESSRQKLREIYAKINDMISKINSEVLTLKEIKTK